MFLLTDFELICEEFYYLVFHLVQPTNGSCLNLQVIVYHKPLISSFQVAELQAKLSKFQNVKQENITSSAAGSVSLMAGPPAVDIEKVVAERSVLNLQTFNKQTWLYFCFSVKLFFAHWSY
jgi:hypothetical protein